MTSKLQLTVLNLLKDNINLSRRELTKLVMKLGYTNKRTLTASLTRCLKLLERKHKLILIKQNGFTNEKTPEETKFLMVQNGKSLGEFATEVLFQSNGEKIDKETMYQVYCKWCSNHKPQLSPDSKDKLGKTLIKFTPFISSQSNGKERYWLNVKITDSYDKLKNNMSNYSNSIKESNNDVKNNIYNFSKPVIPVSKDDINDTLFKNPTQAELKLKPLHKI